MVSIQPKPKKGLVGRCGCCEGCANGDVSIQPKPKKGLVGTYCDIRKLILNPSFNPAEAEEGFSSLGASFFDTIAIPFQSSRSRRRV